jgi:hypothetical protein
MIVDPMCWAFVLESIVCALMGKELPCKLADPPSKWIGTEAMKKSDKVEQDLDVLLDSKRNECHSVKVAQMFLCFSYILKL